MGTWIVLHSRKTKEYAVFDYKPGNATNTFYEGVRDKHIVANSHQAPAYTLGNDTCISVPEFIKKHGIPKCIERLYIPNGWIPF